MALPLGVESFDEVLDVELDESPKPEELQTRLGACLPPGLDLLACEHVGGTRGVRVRGARFEVPLDEASVQAALDGTKRFHASERPLVVRERKGRVREIPLRDYVRDLSVEDKTLCFSLVFQDGAGMKPDELLQWLGLDPVAQRVVKRETLLEPTDQTSTDEDDGDSTEDDRDGTDDAD